MDGCFAAGQRVGGWFAEARVGFGFPGRRAKEDLTWVFPTAEREGVREQLAGLRNIDGEELEQRRIAAGIPAVPADIGPGDLPGEGGLEAVAISYTKGCYLGQEVMARLKSMGQVRRRLRRVAGPGPVPQVPAPLWQEGRQVGELRSAVATENGFAGFGDAFADQPAGGVAACTGGRQEVRRSRFYSRSHERTGTVDATLRKTRRATGASDGDGGESLKRADQLVAERGRPRERLLGHLLRLLVQGRSGEVPEDFPATTPPPATGGTEP